MADVGGATKVRAGARVELTLDLESIDGELVDRWDEDEPLEIVQGEGDLPEALERALEGEGAGFEVELELAPEEAFGEYDPDAVVAVPRDEFPEDVELEASEWIRIEIDEEDGGETEAMDARVLEIEEDTVFLDANHPLAGRRVRFRARILAVHPGESS